MITHLTYIQTQEYKILEPLFPYLIINKQGEVLGFVNKLGKHCDKLCRHFSVRTKTKVGSESLKEIGWKHKGICHWALGIKH